MNWTLLGFGVAGIGLVVYGVFVLKSVHEQVKTGKTEMTGKLFAKYTKVDKTKNPKTFWLMTGWNAIRGVLAILIGGFFALGILAAF